MAVIHEHSTPNRLPGDERLHLGEPGPKLYRTALMVGGGGLVLAFVLSFFSAGGFRRFLFSYLVAFMFCLSIALGALVFVLIQHLTRAGWSVTARRTAEAIAATLPWLGVASLPILFSVLSHNGDLYRWALPKSAEDPKAAQVEGAIATGHEASQEQEHDPAKVLAAGGPRLLDKLTLKKRAWLNPVFFSFRIILYFAVWSAIALYYWRLSNQQDRTGDVELTSRMQKWAPLSVIACALTITFASFDLVMSLDPHWFSTIFGVYFFAGAAVASFATWIIAVYLLQRFGYLGNSLSREHYHDLGKFLFGFVFFWGYIAFSQYMLLWYANIPEETSWFIRHGATTVRKDITGWSYLIVVILFGHLLIPFAGLLSRHVKRRPGVLVFWAVWMLVFHYLDLYWVIMPEMGHPLYFVRGDGHGAGVADAHPAIKAMGFGLVDLAALAGLGGVMLAAFFLRLSGQSLRPVADPRLDEALAFQNI